MKQCDLGLAKITDKWGRWTFIWERRNYNLHKIEKWKWAPDYHLTHAYFFLFYLIQMAEFEEIMRSRKGMISLQNCFPFRHRTHFTPYNLIVRQILKCQIKYNAWFALIFIQVTIHSDILILYFFHKTLVYIHRSREWLFHCCCLWTSLP